MSSPVDLASLAGTITNLTTSMNSLRASVDSASGGGGGGGGGGDVAGAAASAAGSNPFAAMLKGAGKLATGAAGAAADTALNMFGNIEKGFGEIGERILELQKRSSDARAQFAKTTGMMDQARGIYSSVGRSLRGLGMDFGEMSSHLAGLIKAIPTFIDLSNEEQKVIGRQSGMFARLGVDAGTYASSFNFMQKSLGLSVPEIAKTNNALYGLARNLRLPPEVIMKNFGTAMPKLILFGKQAPDIFARAESYAKKLGISMETITNQIDKFSTFEDAADAAGKINALMGQNLIDTQELLYANPTEKVKIFTGALEKMKSIEGREFEDWNEQKKRALAQMSGFSVDDLQKMSKQTTAELGKLDGGKLVDNAGDAAEAAMRKNVRATVSLNDSIRMMNDSITSLLSFLGDKFGVTFQNTFKNSAEMAKAFAKKIKSDPDLLEVAQTITSSKMVGTTGINKMNESMGKILLSPLDEKTLNKVLPMLNNYITKLGAVGIDVTKLSEKEAPELIAAVFGAKNPDQVINVAKKLTKTYGTATEMIGSALYLSPEDQKKFASGIVGAGDMAVSGLELVLKDFPKAQQDLKKQMSILAKEDMSPVEKIGKGLFRTAFPSEEAEKEFQKSTLTTKQIADKGYDRTKETYEQYLARTGTAISQGLKMQAEQSAKNAHQEVARAFDNQIPNISKAVADSTSTGINSGVASSMVSKQSVSLNQQPVKSPTPTPAAAAAKPAMETSICPKVCPEAEDAIKKLTDALTKLNTITINPQISSGLDKLNGSITALNPTLQALDKNKNSLFLTLSSVTQVEVDRIASLSAVIERYANALKTAKMYDDEQDKIKNILKDIGKVLAESFQALNGTDVGNAMAIPIVNAIRNAFGGR